MRKYELMILLSSRLDENSTLDATQKVADLLKSQNGIITKTDVWGRRRLAYSIENHTEATYVLFNVQLDPSVLKELEFNLKLNEEVIRYMFVRDVLTSDDEDVSEEETVTEVDAETSDLVTAEEEALPLEEASPSGEGASSTGESSEEETTVQTPVLETTDVKEMADEDNPSEFVEMETKETEEKVAEAVP